MHGGSYPTHRRCNYHADPTHANARRFRASDHSWGDSFAVREHHRRAVGRLVERFGNDPKFPALIIGGSIARGWERDDSDVDFVLLATDDEYARRKATNAFAYYATDLCDYPGGYVDGKIVDWQFLQDVAERGNEPSRAAYVGVTIAYSRVPGLDDLLERITTYPAHERAEKNSFVLRPSASTSMVCRRSGKT
jgi:hypothetical protein